MKFCERTKALGSILFVMYLVGFTIAIPSAVIPGLQSSVFGGDAFVITGALAAVKGFLGFIYTPLLGSFTDRYGRKVPLIVCLSLSVIPYAIMLFADFWAYSIANCFLGLYDAVMTILLTLAADRIPTSCGVRTEAFAMVMAAFFAGISTGPFLGAFLSESQTFISCAIVQLFVAILSYKLFDDEGPRMIEDKQVRLTTCDGATCAEEGTTAVAVCPITHKASSLPPKPTTATANITEEGEPVDQQVEGEEQSDTSDEHDLTTTKLVLTEQELEYSRCVYKRVILALCQSKNLRLCTLVIFWNSLAEQVFDKLLLLYLQESLNFDSTEQAIVIAILGVGALIGLLIVIPIMKHFLGIQHTLTVGLLMNGVVAVLYAVAKVHWLVMGATGLSVVGMTVFPCAVAMSTKSVTEDAVGIAQGLATASRMIAAGISPLLFGLLFNATKHTSLPGCAFLIAAACCIVAVIINRFVKH